MILELNWYRTNIFSYFHFRYPQRNHIFCSDSRCKWAIIISYLLPIFLCSPTYFVLSIRDTKVIEDKEYILYYTSLSDVALNNDNYLIFNFWMYAVFIKLLPCCILTFIIFWLIKTLFGAKKRKNNLRNFNENKQEDKEMKNKVNKRERRAQRTTKMLLAVLILFLITEFPQGIFGLLIGMKGKCIFLKCYQNFGELMDILALLNGSINFILYCCMNRMFRTNFALLFKNKMLIKWIPPVQSDIRSTYL